jgi:membrane dipeptidase
MITVFDAHSDTLLKMWEDPSLDFFEANEKLQVSYPEMERGNVQLQALAIWIPNRVPYHHRSQSVLEMIDLFYEKVAGEKVRPILSRADLDECVLKGRKGAILFVEGAHPLDESLVLLRTWYRLGVRGMTLTWNYRNAVADGCHEPNPGGLTSFGKKVVEEMNRLGMMIDVSHVAEPGFWDTLELSSAPVIASHSNVKRLCNHPRNLSDEQIKALIEKGGVMGLTFVDFFVTSEKRTVWIDDLLRHLDHVCALGGVDHVAFGSDFDGITETFGDMTRAGDYVTLTEALLKRYKEADVKKFMLENWLRVFRNVLQ